ncbi:MAG: phospholipid/cholesterol/gamma-HCH transport system substrate-binding protein [Actinomycetota bacterium]|nr:phospholipid/cholesterol/gamma-HCH transport system substrate-binding protein [Actinomycetota bacterium]
MTGVRWIAVKLAIFTAVTLAVTTWLAADIGNLSLFSHPYQIEAQFTDATGLLSGDVVKAAGVTVGHVTDIRIADGVALVTLDINDGTRLPSPLSARIRFRNLLGQREVDLTSTARSDALTKAGTMIPLARTEPAFDLTVLFNGLRPLIRSTDPADINIVTHELLKALAGRSNDVESLLGNLGQISNAVANKDTQLGGLLRNVNTITSDLSNRNAQLTSTLGDLNSLLTQIAASRGDLGNAIVSLSSAAQRLRRIVATNDGRIKGETHDLATVLAAISAHRPALEKSIKELPNVLAAVERVTSYGEWANIHLIDVCKDDFGTCGKRWLP